MTTAYERKNGNGSRWTKEQKKADTIKGLKKYMIAGAYDMVLLKERQLMNEYGVSAEELEEIEINLFN